MHYSDTTSLCTSRYVTKVRWSAAPPPLNFSRVALRHLYFSRGEFRFEKLRNAELHERGGEKQGRNYVTHNDKKRSKKGHQNISLLRVTGCQIVWAPPPLESYFDHLTTGLSTWVNPHNDCYNHCSINTDMSIIITQRASQLLATHSI